MGGRAGMDYTAVLAYLRQREKLRGAALDEVFDALQAAEWALLEVLAEAANE